MPIRSPKGVPDARPLSFLPGVPFDRPIDLPPPIASWCWDLFPQTPVAPPEGDEHEDNATDDELFHG